MSDGCAIPYSDIPVALPGIPQFKRDSARYLGLEAGGYKYSIRSNRTIGDGNANTLSSGESERLEGFYNLIDSNDSQKTYLSRESDIAALERDARLLAQKVASNRLRPFRKQETSRGAIRTFPGPDAKLISRLASIPRWWLDGCGLSPEMHAVAAANSRKDVSGLWSTNFNEVVDEKKVHGHISDWISIFRSSLQSKEVKKKVSNRKTHERRRRDSVWRRIRKALSRFRRVLVGRVDLCYALAARWEKSAEDFRRDYARLINNMRMNRSVSKGLILMINKIEYAADKGFHVHSLLLLDGDVVRSDAYTCEQLGRYWKETVTKGEGGYFNGNRKSAKKLLAKYIKSNIDDLALGLVRPENSRKMEELGKVVRYFSKYDQSPLFSGSYRKDLRVIQGPRMRARTGAGRKARVITEEAQNA